MRFFSILYKNNHRNSPYLVPATEFKTSDQATKFEKISQKK